MEKGCNSTYDLLTKLCEKYVYANQSQRSYSKSVDVRRARSKCYEILLSKRASEICGASELENIKDPFCHLLAWQYQLDNKFQLPQQAEKLKICSEKLQKLHVFDDKTCTNVVLLLLELRRVPVGEDKIMETTINRNCINENISDRSSFFPSFDESRFHLSEDLPPIYSRFQNESFQLHNKKIVISNAAISRTFNDHSKKFVDTPSQTTIKMDNFPQTSKSEIAPGNIWEFVAREPFTSRHTWEEFGHLSTFKEPPFLCESSSKASEWLQNLSPNFDNMALQREPMKVAEARIFVEFKDFVKDAQHLLVGMESKTFKFNAQNELTLVPGICMEGLSAGTIRAYCKDLIFCTNCYTGLTELCTPNTLTLNYVNNGYIFTELCESIKNYLSYYRVAIFSITNTTSLLAFHERTKQLRDYTTTLASVCEVGPFSESGQIPHGVALLNYLYQKVMCITNKNVLMVLYSVLYPCCQVYFSRFLQRWILEGSVHDPFGEFFIQVNPKYVNTRGRTYWTRSYTVQKDIVPDFIADLYSDILLCGKAMNLLKLCVANCPLSDYLTDKQSNIVCCCIMSEQLAAVELNNHYYYLEATALSGPRLCMSHIISCRHEEDKVFLNLVAKKRAATLYRIELERKREAEVINEKRQAEMKILQEQYAQAQKDKQVKILQEIQEEILTMEKNMRIQVLHDKIIQEEASNLIHYYHDLFEASESKRKFFERRIEGLRKVELSHVIESRQFIPITSNIKGENLDSKKDEELVCSKTNNEHAVIELHIKESQDFIENSIAEEDEQPTLTDIDIKESQNMTRRSGSSTTFLSGSDDFLGNKSDEYVSAHSLIPSVDYLDYENANYDVEKSEQNSNTIDNFKVAQKNKTKVLDVEMEVKLQNMQDTNLRNVNLRNTTNDQLTEAQRNKLKVMSSEFDINVNPIIWKTSSSIAEINKNKIMSSNSCFYPEDNRKKIEDANKNSLENKNINLNCPNKWVKKKQDTLSLDFSKIGQSKTVKTVISNSIKSPKFELDRISPMSVDSTTLSDITPLEKITASIDNYDFENLPSSSIANTVTASTAAINLSEAFDFQKSKPLNMFQLEDCKLDLTEKMDNLYFSKNISIDNTESISSNCLKLCLQQSISIPLITQMKLVTNELLKYFINNLHYLKHLNNLKSYFFLMDGEFGRHMTEGLFEKLYESNFPIDLININTLQSLVYKALDYSTKYQEDLNCLSFRINNLPKVFDLGNPDVFDCISLTYKVVWPLNILLPSDTISRYDEVFKFLLKLHRVSWVLKSLFQNLKSLIKEAESNKTRRLLRSTQYCRLQQCRHVMTHFMQTLQSYVVSEVLQTNWEIFEKNLESVVNFDQLYALHTTYIKNIRFMCLLHERMTPLRRVLQKIFMVILKFYDYVRSRSWTEEDGLLVHPNFDKLENIFKNFEELVTYFFKVCHKVAKSGYQANIIQLLSMLDINNYYSGKC